MFASMLSARSAPPDTAKLAACATDGCPSRSSRPSSSATTRSPTTCPRARSPTGGSPISASTRRRRGRLDELLLCYGDHLGDPSLREAVAAGGDGLRADDVLVTPGAAAALFATATSLLEPGDHAVVVRTNYATNLETPRAIGADLDIVDLAFDDGWQLDVDARRGARAAGRRRG